jgi:arylsulfatase A-like enzyme
VPGKPNIVIIMTDDQRWDAIGPRFMPYLNTYLIPHGMRLKNAFVSNSLCCPSRVTTLTGKYSYTTGVYGNGGTWGGYDGATRYGSMDDTMAIDLHNDGYRTGLVGKYLNGYNPENAYRIKPAGWNRWFAIGTSAYYDYWAAVNGVRKVYFGDAPGDYSTRVLSRRAVGFIDRSRRMGVPFFLYFAVTAPHSPQIADPRDIGRFDTYVRSYRHPSSFGEANVSDKPPYIKALPWSVRIARARDTVHANQLATAYGADRAIGRIWRALPWNTVVLFMSDNGYLWGEHRWPQKQVPYNESLRVPIVIAAKHLSPSAGASLSSIAPGRVAVNVDIRATLESFVAGLPAPTTDGEAWTGTQHGHEFPIMHWNYAPGVPTYCGVRSMRWMYVKYADGFEEAYDEKADPLELRNLFVTDRTNPELPVLASDAAAYCDEQPGRIYPAVWPYP